jgi:hypothetical protein
VALRLSNRKMILLTALLSLSAFSLIARADEDDDFMEVSHRTQDTSRKRAYAGSRDEQGLEIQAALPQPTRSQDGSAVLTDDGADLPTQAPASD